MLHRSRTSPGPPPPGVHEGVHTCSPINTLVYRRLDVLGDIVNTQDSMQKGMKNTGILSTSFNGECYRNDQREENNDKGNRMEEDRERKRDCKHDEKRPGR